MSLPPLSGYSALVAEPALANPPVAPLRTLCCPVAAQVDVGITGTGRIAAAAATRLCPERLLRPAPEVLVCCLIHVQCLPMAWLARLLQEMRGVSQAKGVADRLQ